MGFVLYQSTNLFEETQMNAFKNLVAPTIKKSYSAYTSKDGAAVSQDVHIHGTIGVCEQYSSANGLITQFDLLGTLLYDAGLNPGRKVVVPKLTGAEALSLLQGMPLAVPTEVKELRVLEGKKWKNYLEFEVTYRKFKNSMEASMAMAYLDLKIQDLHTVADVLRVAKRTGRAMSEFYVVACPSGRVYNGLINKMLTVNPDWTYMIKKGSPKDGNIDLDPTWANDMGLRIGQMYGKATAGIGGGQLKGKATVVEKSLTTDIVFHDSEKPEITLGVKYLALGSPCHNGSEIYTDLMLVNKSKTLTASLLEVFQADKQEIVDGLHAHQKSASIFGSILEKGLVEEGNYSQAVQLSMAKEAARKMGLPGREGRKSGSTVQVMAQKGVDASLHPLVTNLFSLFIVGKTGTVANKFRARIPGGGRMYFDLWDPTCWNADLEPKGREITVTYTVDGELIGLCSLEVWPEVQAATGGSDFDDSWLKLLFQGIRKATLKEMDKDFPGMGKLSATATLAWIFRQPDGPGDGVPVGIKWGRCAFIKGMYVSPEDAFEGTFSGDLARTIWDEITTNILAIRSLRELLPEMDRVWKNSHSTKPQAHMYVPSVPSHEKKYENGALGMFKSKVVKKPEAPMVENKSIVWHEAESKGVLCKSIGDTANLLAIVVEGIVSGRISMVISKMTLNDIALLRYAGHMIINGGLESIVDFNNMGKLPADREVDGVVLTGKEQLEKLFWIHVESAKVVDSIEYAHLFGGEGHKKRLSRLQGVNLFGLCKELSHAHFTKKEVSDWHGVPETRKKDIMEIFLNNLESNHLTDEGRIAIAEACKVTVVKDYLSAFRTGIYTTMNAARVGVHLNTVEYQVRWIEGFMKKLGMDQTNLGQIMEKFIPADVRNTIGRVLKVRSDSSEARNRAIVLETLSFVKSEEEARTFFKALTVADLIQLRMVDKGAEKHVYSGLFDAANGQWAGWITQAKQGLFALKVLKSIEDGKEVELDPEDPIHKQVISLQEKGFIEGPWGLVALEDAWKLRTFCNIPKGAVIGFDDDGTEVRDSSWTIFGQTYQEWYADVWHDVIGDVVEFLAAKKEVK